MTTRTVSDPFPPARAESVHVRPRWDDVLRSPAYEGDELEITSRLIELRHVSDVWHHEVRRPDGAPVAIDRARGAFLGLDGRIRPAPAMMLDDLLRGEPGD